MMTLTSLTKHLQTNPWSYLMTQLLMDPVPQLPQRAKPGEGLPIYLQPLFCFLGLVSRDVLTEHSRKLVWERDLKQPEL